MGARSSKQERQQHRQVMGAETPEAPLGPSLDEIGAARRQAQAAKERVLQQQGARPGGGVPEPEGRRVNEELKSTTDYASRLQEQAAGSAPVPHSGGTPLPSPPPGTTAITTNPLTPSSPTLGQRKHQLGAEPGYFGPASPAEEPRKEKFFEKGQMHVVEGGKDTEAPPPQRAPPVRDATTPLAPGANVEQVLSNEPPSAAAAPAPAPAPQPGAAQRAASGEASTEPQGGKGGERSSAADSAVQGAMEAVALPSPPMPAPFLTPDELPPPYNRYFEKGKLHVVHDGIDEIVDKGPQRAPPAPKRTPLAPEASLEQLWGQDEEPPNARVDKSVRQEGHSPQEGQRQEGKGGQQGQGSQPVAAAAQAVANLALHTGTAAVHAARTAGSAAREVTQQASEAIRPTGPGGQEEEGGKGAPQPQPQARQQARAPEQQQQQQARAAPGEGQTPAPEAEPEGAQQPAERRGSGSSAWLTPEAEREAALQRMAAHEPAPAGESQGAAAQQGQAVGAGEEEGEGAQQASEEPGLLDVLQHEVMSGLEQLGHFVRGDGAEGGRGSAEAPSGEEKGRAPRTTPKAHSPAEPPADAPPTAAPPPPAPAPAPAPPEPGVPPPATPGAPGTVERPGLVIGPTEGGGPCIGTTADASDLASRLRAHSPGEPSAAEATLHPPATVCDPGWAQHTGAAGVGAGAAAPELCPPAGSSKHEGSGPGDAPHLMQPGPQGVEDVVPAEAVPQVGVADRAGAAAIATANAAGASV